MWSRGKADDGSLSEDGEKTVLNNCSTHSLAMNSLSIFSRFKLPDVWTNSNRDITTSLPITIYDISSASIVECFLSAVSSFAILPLHPTFSDMLSDFRLDR